MENTPTPQNIDDNDFIMDLSDSISFRSEDAKKLIKFDKDDYWQESTVISCNKFSDGIHKFSVKIISTIKNKILIGVVSEKFKIRDNHIGADENSWSYYVENGNKCIRAKEIPYGTRSEIGDLIDVTLDLDCNFGKLEVFRNGIPMGILATGIKNKCPLFFGVSCKHKNDIVECSYEKIK